MLKDAKLTGEMYIFVQWKQKTCMLGELRIKKTTKQTKSNYFYYHIVLLQLYSEIFFRSKKKKEKMDA